MALGSQPPWRQGSLGIVVSGGLTHWSSWPPGGLSRDSPHRDFGALVLIDWSGTENTVVQSTTGLDWPSSIIIPEGTSSSSVSFGGSGLISL
jgi:hypothetical protein